VITGGNAGFGITRHFGLQVGYNFLADARINGTEDRLGVGIRTSGPQVGLTARW
jgi:hypothetical protein